MWPIVDDLGTWLLTLWAVRRPSKTHLCGLPRFHDGKDLVDRWLEEQSLLGDDFAVHEDGQLATFSIHQLDRDTRLLRKSRRQTGGVPANFASDRTLPDCDVFHRIAPFRKRKHTMCLS